GAGLGAWVVFGALTDIWTRTGKGDLAGRFRRLARLSRADWGRVTAHAGMGVTLFAVAAMNAWKVEDIRVLREGESYALGRYEVMLRQVEEVRGPNYLSTIAEMGVSRNGRPVTTLFPEKRFYPVQGMPTTEAAIDYGFWRDIYLVIGDPQDGGGWAVRSYIEPFANWLWGGALMMAFGGGLSLSDRRYRVAAGARRAAVAVPAE
ncbi:MAG: heme lyase NrfEFG subunit NrfE, partial [Tabrizicola sp.]|nr:heme lyase NrfEFG subunit NrfE [Tabrizicola sp.]